MVRWFSVLVKGPQPNWKCHLVLAALGFWPSKSCCCLGRLGIPGPRVKSVFQAQLMEELFRHLYNTKAGLAS